MSTATATTPVVTAVETPEEQLENQVKGLASELQTPNEHTHGDNAGTVLTGCKASHIKQLHGGATIPFVAGEDGKIKSIIIGSTKKLNTHDYMTRAGTTCEWTDGLGIPIAIKEFPAELRHALEGTTVSYICSANLGPDGKPSALSNTLSTQIGDSFNLHSFDPKKKIYTFVGRLRLLKVVNISQQNENGKFTNVLYLFTA